MKIDKTSKYFIISLHALAVILVSILFFCLLQNIDFFKGYFGYIIKLAMPFAYGFVIAYLVNPIMKFFEKHVVERLRIRHKALKRGLSLLLAYVFAGTLITIFFSSVLPEVMTSLYGLVSAVPTYAVYIRDWINSNLSWYLEQMPFTEEQIQLINLQISNTLTSSLEKLQEIIPHLYGYTMAVTTVVKNLLLGVIISVYMLVSKEKFAGEARKCIYALLPVKRGDQVVSLSTYINKTFSGFIYAKVLDSFIIGILCFIGMSILRLPYVMLISLIVGVTNVIPYFGPFIGAIPSIILLAFIDFRQAFIFSIFVLALQQFDGNILGPKLLGDSIGLSAFWVIFAVLVMGGVFGAMGMFIGVPMFAVIYTISKELLEKQLRKKGLSVFTSDYMDPKE
ncbi:MAG: AI-2E family transporter [Eubacteriales bacterium]|jgi:predicted PurR-regulated permease PerM